MSSQHLTLSLDGITAADYLAWVSDPEPPALAGELRSIEVGYAPLGDSIELTLRWKVAPPAAEAAATAAGFPITPEVVSVTWRQDELAPRRRRPGRRIRPRPATAAA